MWSRNERELIVEPEATGQHRRCKDCGHEFTLPSFRWRCPNCRRVIDGHPGIVWIVVLIGLAALVSVIVGR